MFSKRAGMWLAAGVLCLGCSADTVYLSDGSEIEGKVTEENANTVVIRMTNGSARSLRRADVNTIIYERRGLEPTLLVKAGTEEKDAKDPKAVTTTTEPKKKDVAPEEEAWTAPPGLPNFPKGVKRIAKEREEVFMRALKVLATPDPDDLKDVNGKRDAEEARKSGKSTISGMGTDGLPYVVAVLKDDNPLVRGVAMEMVGTFGGKSAVKQAIEAFDASLSDSDKHFLTIHAARSTLQSITGQDFFTGEFKPMLLRADASYVEWYNKNYESLSPQLGEPKLEKKDADYSKKLKDARELKDIKNAKLIAPEKSPQ